MKKDYGTYQFQWKEKVRYLAEATVLCAGVNWLFYQNIWAFLPLPAIVFIYFRLRKQQKIREQQRELNYQFKDMLDSLNVTLQAGYSVENAISLCARELERLYGREADLTRELREMEDKLKLSVPVERLFMDLGSRSHSEDVENFAAVFQTAKRSGGDMRKILEKSAQMLGDKIEVKKEIEAVLTAKKSEQRLMSVMPFGIILYMSLTSPGFLEVLYGNLFGAAVMTGCLAVYLFAWWLGNKIVDIEV